MLSRYFGLAAVPSWLASVAIVGGLQGLYVSGYAAWVAWLVRRRAANPVLLAGGWVACEFARAHGALGSPWALAAYSQVRWTPLIQIADLAGPYGIGMLVAAVNAGAAALLDAGAARASADARGDGDRGGVGGRVPLRAVASRPDVRRRSRRAGSPSSRAARRRRTRRERAARLARYAALTTGGAAPDPT